jgi:DNA-binding NtrC family response regulator
MAEILVLDDVVDAAVLVGKILTKKGHTVHTFNEEAPALKFVEEQPVDLVILDIKLKEMSGVEVLALMKKSKPGVRAIMLTGYPTVDTAREAISLGADEYCVKPIDRQELEDKVEKALNNKNRTNAMNSIAKA